MLTSFRPLSQKKVHKIQIGDLTKIRILHFLQEGATVSDFFSHFFAQYVGSSQGNYCDQHPISNYRREELLGDHHLASTNSCWRPDWGDLCRMLRSCPRQQYVQDFFSLLPMYWTPILEKSELKVNILLSKRTKEANFSYWAPATVSTSQGGEIAGVFCVPL